MNARDLKLSPAQWLALLQKYEVPESSLTGKAAPDIAAPGRPIMVRVNAANAGDVLTVSSFTLTAANGTVVAARIIVPSAALTGSSAGVTADVNNGVFLG